jgi:hypothetical protein
MFALYIGGPKADDSLYIGQTWLNVAPSVRQYLAPSVVAAMCHPFVVTTADAADDAHRTHPLHLKSGENYIKVRLITRMQEYGLLILVAQHTARTMLVHLGPRRRRHLPCCPRPFHGRTLKVFDMLKR